MSRAPVSTPVTASAPSASAVTGPPLVRLLARLSGPGALASPAATAPFAERLGQWLHWTDAAALYQALDGAVQAPVAPDAGAAAPIAPLAQALHRARETLARTIEADCDAARTDVDGDDFSAWRRLVTHRLQSVQASLAPLRERLRECLATQAPTWARLAEVDAVMERTLAPQERALLTGTLPSLLQHHFDRVKAEAHPADAWRDPFCDELQAVLMAALDLSLQPLDGLLAALRAATTAPPASASC